MIERLTQRDLQTLEWWTVRELANRWHCSSETIWRRYRAGEISAMPLGKTIRIHQSEVDRHEAKGKREKTVAAVARARQWNKPAQDIIGDAVARRKAAIKAVSPLTNN